MGEREGERERERVESRDPLFLWMPHVGLLGFHPSSSGEGWGCEILCAFSQSAPKERRKRRAERRLSKRFRRHACRTKLPPKNV